MANPSAQRIETGYRHARGTTGGYATEIWEVKGIDPMLANGDQAVAAGLPNYFQPHPTDSKLIVRERTIEQVIDTQVTWVRVDYRPASFDIGTQYGSVSRTVEPLKLRLIWTRITSPGNNGWWLRGGNGDEQTVVKLWQTARLMTVYAGGDQDFVDYCIEINKGKWYKLGSSPYDRLYVLSDGSTRKARDGRVVAEYTFLTHQGFEPIPSGTYPGQSVSIPACPPAGMIFTKIDNPLTPPLFEVRTAQQLYDKGKELPGL
jgi:hypothetical protein